MKKSHALAYVRQLCCLGLSRESLIAELLQTIKTAIPSDSNVFADWDGAPFPSRYIIDCMDQDAFGVLLGEADTLFTADMVGNIARWHERNTILDRLEIISEMDCAGRLLFASEAAKRLLSWARYPAYPVGQKGVIQEIAVPAELSRLCRNLDGIFRGRETPPPTLVHTNPRGRFLFRAHWLDSANREPGGLVGVTVEHQEPAALCLLRRIKDLPLSPTQMEVCLLLAQNHSQESIARRLHIKPTTAKDHVRKIYRKLDIHRREELASRLLADNPAHS